MPVTRNYGDLRVDVIGPVFSRVFNPNNAIADRMKHVIEPTFSVQRRTEIANQDRIPTATGYDIIVGGVTQMNYGAHQPHDGPEGQGGPAAGGRAARDAQCVRAAELLHRREREPVRHSYSYGYNNRRAECVFADLADRARDADTAAGHRLPAEYDPLATVNQPEAARHGPERHPAFGAAST